MGRSNKWDVHDFGPEDEEMDMRHLHPANADAAVSPRAESAHSDPGILTFLEYAAIGFGGTIVVVAAFFFVSWISR